MDKSADAKDAEVQHPDNIHIGNHCIDTIPSKFRGFKEELRIFKKGRIDRSCLPNQRDGWYISTVYLANTEAFYDFLKLIQSPKDEFCIKGLPEASRKVRHGGFHELQVILLRHCEMSPSFLYAPDNNETSWQVIQVCRLLNLLKKLDVRTENPFALEMEGLVQYYRARSGNIRGISYYSYFYGMVDNDASGSETLFEICAIRDKLAYGPNVYRAIASIYAGSRNKNVNGFDGHKHLASPFLPTVHLEVFYRPSAKFIEGESPNPHNTVLALKEMALQFNRYGNVIEPAEVYNVARDGSLDKWGIPNQEDFERFADSGVWNDDWDLKTQDSNLSWPGKYPFDLDPAPVWDWGALEKEPENGESEMVEPLKAESQKVESQNAESQKVESQNAESQRVKSQEVEPQTAEPQNAEPVAENMSISSLKAEHNSIRVVPVPRTKFAFSSLRFVMKRTVRSWKEATEQPSVRSSARTSNNLPLMTWGGAGYGASNPSSSGTWKSLRRLKGVLRRNPLPAAFRSEETETANPGGNHPDTQCQLIQPGSTAKTPKVIANEEAMILNAMREPDEANAEPANTAGTASPTITPCAGQRVLHSELRSNRSIESMSCAEAKVKAKRSSLLEKVKKQLCNKLGITPSTSPKSIGNGWES